MTERCLQTLAILLAGLFSAERSRDRARFERAMPDSEPPEQREAAARDAKPAH